LSCQDLSVSAWAGALAKTIPATVERMSLGEGTNSFETEVGCIGIEVWMDADQVADPMTLECPEAGFW
jgi:ribosomal protein S3